MRRFLATAALLLAACATSVPPADTNPYVQVLGIAQDGGYPGYWLLVVGYL